MIKKYKLPVTRYVSSGDVMYSVKTMVNNIIYLKVSEKVDIKSSHHTHKNVTM